MYWSRNVKQVLDCQRKQYCNNNNQSKTTNGQKMFILLLFVCSAESRGHLLVSLTIPKNLLLVLKHIGGFAEKSRIPAFKEQAANQNKKWLPKSDRKIP